MKKNLAKEEVVVWTTKQVSFSSPFIKTGRRLLMGSNIRVKAQLLFNFKVAYKVSTVELKLLHSLGT